MKKLGVEAGANLMGKELEIKETQTRPRARPPVGVNSSLESLGDPLTY
jgi:hypothetical protein